MNKGFDVEVEIQKEDIDKLLKEYKIGGKIIPSVSLGALGKRREK